MHEIMNNLTKSEYSFTNIVNKIIYLREVYYLLRLYCTNRFFQLLLFVIKLG